MWSVSTLYFLWLFLITYLEDIEFQVIGFVGRPQDRVIRRLCAVFHLAKSLVCTSCGLANRFCKQFIFHKMGTGTGCKKSAVFYQFHSTKIDLTVAFDCIFDRTARFCKGRWIQNDHIVLFSLFFELRKQFKNIFTYKFYGFIKPIQFRLFLCLVNIKLRSF